MSPQTTLLVFIGGFEMSPQAALQFLVFLICGGVMTFFDGSRMIKL